MSAIYTTVSKSTQWTPINISIYVTLIAEFLFLADFELPKIITFCHNTPSDISIHYHVLLINLEVKLNIHTEGCSTRIHGNSPKIKVAQDNSSSQKARLKTTHPDK